MAFCPGSATQVARAHSYGATILLSTTQPYVWCWKGGCARHQASRRGVGVRVHTIQGEGAVFQNMLGGCDSYDIVLEDVAIVIVVLAG